MQTKTKNNHIGRKIGRIRELRGMKQETLAEELGISQQAISNIENSEKVDEAKLEEIAKALGVTKEGIQQFNEESIFNYFNSFHDSSAFNTHCTFNPLDKLMEAHDENKKLYERLLEAEKEKVAYLEKLFDKK
ncbi:helix-turn-helix domain-containing protein [Flagellimonas algicola]|uniref:Helix-turn-helix transcriptional regulator n=1 Tax=Flagellimonas algicola TaxID=2583815 RepID=A0ABY2WR21_9FLAO|nr:helix-turn-helix transcriptional regulator [Allomuricauda algicola]TMU57451.1 helix-turn-helix transcriptional regulator [Allomuricauda algicola]